MKRKLLLMALATCVIATMFIGCGKESDYSTTTPDTNVEQDGNSNVDDTTKEDATSKDNSSKEEVKGYDEVFYDEPNWEVEYADESDYFKENELPELKLEYQAMKFVFEDMTKKFKNKEEVTTLEGVELIYSKEVGKTFVCDVANIIPDDFTNDDGVKIVFDRESYKVFGGFKATSTEANVRENIKTNEIEWIVVEVNANTIEGKGTPMTIIAKLVVNEDGTFSYKDLVIQYKFEDRIYASK